MVNALYINQYDECELKKVFSRYQTVIVYERIKTNNGLVMDFYQYAALHHCRTKIIAMNYYHQPLGHGSSESLDAAAHMDIAAIKKHLPRKS